MNALPPPASDELGANATARPRVLVVDDDANLREVLAALLASEGMEPVLASDGDDALRLLRHDPAIAVVLLDLMMPGRDGASFRQAQRADPAISSVPVILMTASIRLTEVDADEVMTKPLNTRFLLDSIRRLLARRRRQLE